MSTVIQLNSRPYDTAALEAVGIRCIRIDLDEGAVPSASAVLTFLDAVAASSGAVAVHCKEGLGRSGTMVAVHLMAAHGFAAREAIGWIRIVRPGCIIGAQQHFLYRLGAALDRLAVGGGGVARTAVAEALLLLEDCGASPSLADKDRRPNSLPRSASERRLGAMPASRSDSRRGWPATVNSSDSDDDAAARLPGRRIPSAGLLEKGRAAGRNPTPSRLRPQSDF